MYNPRSYTTSDITFFGGKNLHISMLALDWLYQLRDSTLSKYYAQLFSCWTVQEASNGNERFFLNLLFTVVGVIILALCTTTEDDDLDIETSLTSVYLWEIVFSLIWSIHHLHYSWHGRCNLVVGSTPLVHEALFHFFLTFLVKFLN